MPALWILRHCRPINAALLPHIMSVGPARRRPGAQRGRPAGCHRCLAAVARRAARAAGAAAARLPAGPHPRGVSGEDWVLLEECHLAGHGRPLALPAHILLQRHMDLCDPEVSYEDGPPVFVNFTMRARRARCLHSLLQHWAQLGPSVPASAAQTCSRTRCSTTAQQYWRQPLTLPRREGFLAEWEPAAAECLEALRDFGACMCDLKHPSSLRNAPKLFHLGT